MGNENLDILKKMLDASNKVLEICASIKNAEGITENKLMYDTILMNLVVIDEADSKLPANIKVKYNFIEWQKIKEYKNNIASDFYQLDIETIWEAIQNQLPFFYDKLQIIISELNKSEKQ